jgi:hypothetical protein
MSATSIVRLALILYCMVAIFSIGLLWINAAASDSVKNSAIALTSVFPLMISVLPYIQAYQQFSVPPKSILDATQTRDKNGKEFSRTIMIENPYATLTIVIRSRLSMVAQQGIWGIQSPDPDDMNRYSAFHFNVLIRMSPSRFRNFSPEMDSYRRWYANVVDVLSPFDWPEVARRTQENLSRKAISKALGLPN